MSDFKVWFLTQMILLCDYCRTFQDGARDQNDINEVVEIRNYFIRKRNRVLALKIAKGEAES